jgi:hypothetical protein
MSPRGRFWCLMGYPSSAVLDGIAGINNPIKDQRVTISIGRRQAAVVALLLAFSAALGFGAYAYGESTRMAGSDELSCSDDSDVALPACDYYWDY